MLAEDGEAVRRERAEAFRAEGPLYEAAGVVVRLVDDFLDQKAAPLVAKDNAAHRVHNPLPGQRLAIRPRLLQFAYADHVLPDMEAHCASLSGDTKG